VLGVLLNANLTGSRTDAQVHKTHGSHSNNNNAALSTTGMCVVVEAYLMYQWVLRIAC